MKQTHLLVGEIVRPQGIRGEVKLRHYTDDPGRFQALETVLRKTPAGYEPLRVQSARTQGEDVYLKLEGVDDRDQAEKLRGAMLYVDRDNALELEEGQYFIADLLGAAVEDTQGRPVGVLKDILSPGATDVLVLDSPEGEILFPMLKTVVLDVDVEKGRILVDENRLSEVAVYENRDTDIIP